MSITVTILETGTIRIRPSHRCQRASRPVPLRRLRVLADRRWTAPLPINTYLVDHPEGPILWDCGESPHAVERGFFPLWQPFFHLSIDIRIGPDEGIGARLAQHGLKPTDLKAVVLSHLHHDHGDGISDLTDAPIYVTREHWKAFSKPIPATLEGAVPQHWPKGFTPRLLEPTGPAVGPWQHSYQITSDGRVLAVDTPGHVPGHISLIVHADQATYLLAGDLTYSQGLLDAELSDGVNNNPGQATDSVRKIKAYARQQPFVFLPAHDPDAARRLTTGEVYTPSILHQPA